MKTKEGREFDLFLSSKKWVGLITTRTRLVSWGSHWNCGSGSKSRKWYVCVITQLAKKKRIGSGWLINCGDWFLISFYRRGLKEVRERDLMWKGFDVKVDCKNVTCFVYALSLGRCARVSTCIYHYYYIIYVAIKRGWTIWWFVQMNCELILRHHWGF